MKEDTRNRLLKLGGERLVEVAEVEGVDRIRFMHVHEGQEPKDMWDRLEAIEHAPNSVAGSPSPSPFFIAVTSAMAEDQIQPYRQAPNVGRDPDVKGMTICDLLDEDDDKSPVARGYSFCSRKDQFVKKHGRSVALGRAVRMLMRIAKV